MIEINHEAINIIQQILRAPVSEENYKHIHAALAVSKKHMIPSQEIISKYLDLANFYKSKRDLCNNISVLEEARDLSKTDYPIIYQIAKSLNTYWTEHSMELCELDLIWLAQYLQKIDDDLSESKYYFSLKGKLKKLYSLIHKVHKFDTQSDQIVETKHTFFLSQLTTKQYEDLTPDERKQRVAEILGKKLRQIYENSIETPETNTKKDSDASN